MQQSEQSRSLLEAVTHYSQGLSEEAEAYLAGRGISRDVARRFELGTVVDPINGHEEYQGWLSIPYLTALGACVSVKFRRLDDGKPKYGQPTGQKQHLYNVADESATVEVGCLRTEDYRVTAPATPMRL